MSSDRSKSLFLSNPSASWQTADYDSRRAKMNDAELDATDAIESYAVRHNKIHINLNVLYMQLWCEWKERKDETKIAKRNKMENLSLFTEWLNQQ